MPTLEDIHRRIKNLDGASKILGSKEIKTLPDVLWEDESIERIVQGMYSNGMGILCATNKRLLFVNKGLIYGLKVEDFPYDKISSIQYETGFITGKLKIFASGNKAEITHIEKGQTKDFGDYVRARITKVSGHAGISRGAAVESLTMDQKLNALERLAKLKEQGILTDAEFQAEKKKLIGDQAI